MDYYTTALQLDQERIEQQDRVAEELFLDGKTDGYNGTKPTSNELEYLKGYLVGIKHKQLEVKLSAQLLDFEGRQVETLATSFGEEF